MSSLLLLTVLALVGVLALVALVVLVVWMLRRSQAGPATGYGAPPSGPEHVRS
ncbi:MAG: hypothetical protein AVDCRST_MAG36-2648 [uncultured Nocardioidaceae bacterium]|uniref:Uncharacterized protein n=1 Tax=uncultured Nocardioidaceae bacterium TaxID=253824 RepID=A0A6J4MLF2_9ACTN|nr:MAG: hypothetical protein AVDCRST_MAG36-2648 [uncultured Nocardioidaceae bacterium]